MNRFVHSLDYFGAEMKLSFHNRQYHGTIMGGIYSLLSCSIIIYGLFYYGQNLLSRSSPQTVFSEEHVLSPEAKKFNLDTFSLAFGIEDSQNFSHIIDPAIYQVTAVNRKRVKVFNETSQTYSVENFLIDINPIRCDPKTYFQVPGTDSYFQNLSGVYNMYCLDYREADNKAKAYFETIDGKHINTDIEIEGDFTADVFSEIEIEFKSCVNKTDAELAAGQTQAVPCLPQAEIDLHLQSSYIGFYLTNESFDPNNYKTPFSNSASDLFWPVSNYMTKYISVLFKNTYIETETGIVFSDVQVQKGFQLASEKETLTHVLDNRFAFINIRFQKAVQDRIFRRYKTIAGVIAEIGGIATFLRLLGSLLLHPISKLQLKKNVINELFEFEQANTHNNKNNNNLDSSPNNPPKTTMNNNNQSVEVSPKIKKIKKLKKPNIGAEQQQIEVPQTPAIEQSNIDHTNLLKQSSFSSPLGLGPPRFSEIVAADFQSPNNSFAKLNNINRADYFTRTASVEGEQQLLQSTFPKLKNPTIIANSQDTITVTNKINDQNKLVLRWYDYLIYFAFPCLSRARKHREQIELCNQKIESELSGVNILRKLSELEKLKHLLLNEQELKLFSTVPKFSVQPQGEVKLSKSKHRYSISHPQHFLNTENNKQYENTQFTNQQISSPQMANSPTRFRFLSSRPLPSHINSNNISNKDGLKIIPSLEELTELKLINEIIDHNKVNEAKCAKEDVSQINQKKENMSNSAIQLQELIEVSSKEAKDSINTQQATRNKSHSFDPQKNKMNQNNIMDRMSKLPLPTGIPPGLGDELIPQNQVESNFEDNLFDQQQQQQQLEEEEEGNGQIQEFFIPHSSQFIAGQIYQMNHNVSQLNSNSANHMNESFGASSKLRKKRKEREDTFN